MDRLAHAVVIIAGIFGIILFFVMCGCRSFLSNRVLIRNPIAVAGVLTVLFIGVSLWSALWGSFAWPAFFVAVVIIGGAVSVFFGDKKSKVKRRGRR